MNKKSVKIRFQFKNPADMEIHRSRSIDNAGNQYWNEYVEWRGEQVYRVYGKNGKQYIQWDSEDEEEEIPQDYETMYEKNTLWEKYSPEFDFEIEPQIEEKIKAICKKFKCKYRLLDWMDIPDDEDWVWSEKNEAYGIEYIYWGGYVWVEMDCKKEDAEKIIKEIQKIERFVHYYEED